jgi:hypothetical protein
MLISWYFAWYLLGIIRQIRPIDNDYETGFEMWIKGTEVTEARRSALAKLKIQVSALNSHPPEVHASSLVGFVPENSPVGTAVRSLQDDQPIRFHVTDTDLVRNLKTIRRITNTHLVK